MDIQGFACIYKMVLSGEAVWLHDMSKKCSRIVYLICDIYIYIDHRSMWDTLKKPSVLSLLAPAMVDSATDLARAWEGLPELRRRAQTLQLETCLLTECSYLQ